MTRILLVEDEEKIARFVQLELEHEGYAVAICGDGRDALDQAAHADLILLDIMLPGLNGLEVLRRLRREGSRVPVILLTARDAVMDKVSGLDMGADDYITKPFAIEELLARIRAALRKRQAAPEAAGEEGVLRCGQLRLDSARRQVFYGDTPVSLTGREFKLLETLLRNQTIVLSRDTLLERVWGYDYLGETNVVDVYILFLRSKIDEVFGVKLIHTVRGVGYVLREDV